MIEKSKLIARAKELTGWDIGRHFKVLTDCSDWMDILRGNILLLGGKYFLIKGNRYETRFGIEDQPKYWVFSAIEMDSGDAKIIKTVFYEEFNVHIGVFRIKCFRSPEKEADVLELVKGDRRFMQGETILDDKGNHIRVIDLIKGKNIMEHIHSIDKPHEEYFHEDLPDILKNLTDCFEAIQLLHENGTCHGDIRNDHIFIDKEDRQYRWIDFDLNQYVSDFDIWSIGNIVNYAVGMGITTFKEILKSDKYSDKIKQSLSTTDASAFFEYRIMNLKKLYPYIPDSLNEILMHFTVKPKNYYSSISEFLEDYNTVLNSEFF